MPGQNNSILWKLLEASLLEWIVLLVAVVVLIWLIFWIRSLFREDEDPTALDHQMLSQFGDLHRQGNLSDEEFRSIKSRLVDRLHSPQENGESTPPPAETENGHE